LISVVTDESGETKFFVDYEDVVREAEDCQRDIVVCILTSYNINY